MDRPTMLDPMHKSADQWLSYEPSWIQLFFVFLLDAIFLKRNQPFKLFLELNQNRHSITKMFLFVVVGGRVV